MKWLVVAVYEAAAAQVESSSPSGVRDLIHFIDLTKPVLSALHYLSTHTLNFRLGTPWHVPLTFTLLGLYSQSHFSHVYRVHVDFQVMKSYSFLELFLFLVSSMIDSDKLAQSCLFIIHEHCLRGCFCSVCFHGGGVGRGIVVDRLEAVDCSETKRTL